MLAFPVNPFAASFHFEMSKRHSIRININISPSEKYFNMVHKNVLQSKSKLKCYISIPSKYLLSDEIKIVMS